MIYSSIINLLLHFNFFSLLAEMQDSSADIYIDKINCHGIPLDMCLAALKYLEKCSAILSSMYTIPTCPVFHSANR